MKKGKKKSRLLLLVLLVLGISVGYALLSSTLSITGIAGIKKNTWDVHWNENSIVETEGSVTATTPAAVTDTEKKNISFAVELELPGDFYEFTADAKNYGTVDAVIDEIKIKFYDSNDEEIETLPSYIKYSFTYDEGGEPQADDPLPAGESKKYRFRIEYDEDATSLPGEPDTIKPVIDIPIGQTVPDDPSKPYKITFDPNGGTVEPTTKNVTRGETIEELPTPTKNGVPFLGWYTDITNGHKITANEIPTGNTTYYAHWADNYTIFNTGQKVNEAFKTLAGDTLNETNPYSTSDTRIYRILKSDTAPDANMTTVNVAADGEIPIYAWYTSNNIYWYTEATKVYTNPDSSFMFGNYSYLQEADTSFDTSLTTDMQGMFNGTNNLNTLNLSNFDTSKVTNMQGMFSGIGKSSLDLSSFDTSNVTNMSAMFASSKAYTINLNSFDTRKVQDMSAMFASSKINSLDLSNFRTPSLTNMASMFAGATLISDLDFSSFDVSHVTSFDGMLSGATGLKTLNISGWNFASVTTITSVFSGASNLETINLSNVNTSHITNMGGLFSGLSKLKEIDMSSFDVSNVTTFGSLLSGCTSLKSINMDNWNFASVNNLTALFNGFTSVKTISLKNVNTSNILSMTAMFNNCSGIKVLDLRSFDTHNVITMNSMFYGMSSLTTIIVSDDFVVDQVTSSNSGSMFQGDTNLIGGLGTPYDSSKTDKEYAHYDGGVSNKGYFNEGNPLYYTIELNANGGTVAPTSIEVTRTLPIGNIPIPERENYTFDGWYTGLTDGTEVTSSYVPTRSQTIHAHWIAKPTNTVTFNPNGGTVNETSRTVVEGQKIGTLPIPVRDGYAFDGWYIDTQAGPKIEHTYIPTSNITVKAKWIEIEAMFDTGRNVNIKLKTLAGTEILPDYQAQTADNNVTAIRKSTTEPTAENKTAEHVISASYSSVPIYAWFDNGTIYWWTEANVAFTHQDMAYMFSGFKNMTSFSGDSINTSLTQDMNNLFWNDTNLATADLSMFNTSRVYNVNNLFSNCSNIESINMNNWDLRSVENQGAFVAVLSIPDNVFKTWTFDNAIFKPDMHLAFEYLDHLETMSFENTDTSKVRTMEEMFYGCSAIETLDLSDWDTSNVTNMDHMFSDCSSLTFADTSSFDTRNVTIMRSMFRSTAIETLDVSNFNTSNVSNMTDFVYLSSNLREINLSNWDFRLYNSLDSWGSVDEMNAIGVTWDVKKIKLDNAIFPQDSHSFFMRYGSLEEVSLKNVDTTYVTDMGDMFSSCTSLEELDLSSFDTSNVTVMSTMFSNCPNLKTIKVSKKFKTNKLTTSTAMFADDTSLVGGNGTVFDTNHITAEYARIDTNDTPGYFTLKTPASNFGNLTSSIRNTANKIANIKE